MKKIFFLILSLFLLLPAMGYAGFPSGSLGSGAMISDGPINQASLSNPIPTTTSIAAATVPIGNPAFTLTVNGTNFIAGSVVKWAGTSKTTTYVGPTQLTAQIDAADLAAAGTAAVTVFNPSPGGGNSNAQTLTIGPYVYVVQDCVLYHAYWNGTALDHSLSANHGTVVTGASFGAQGGVSSLLLDGSTGLVQITNTGPLSSFTIAAWYWKDSSKAVGSQIVGGGTGIWLFYNVGSAQFSTKFFAPYGAIFAISDIVQLDHWYCFIITYNATTHAVNGYSYGALTADSPIDAGDAYSINLDTIGGYNHSDTTYTVKGAIGEVLIFNSEWDQAKVTNYYNATKGRYGY